MSAQSNLLPGVPLIESPIFDLGVLADICTDAELEIAASLHRDGYAVIDFPDADLDQRIDRIRAHLQPLFFDEGPDARGVVYNAGRIQDAWICDEDVRAIAANPQICSLLSKLYGRQVFPFQTLNFKVGTQQPLHTDAVHFSSIPPRFMCGVWLAMEDIDEQAGPLNFVPGSHKWPMIDNAMLGRRGRGQALSSAQQPYEQVWRAMIEASGAQIKTFQARKGQALIWCANLLHGGSVQRNLDLSRWSQVTHYYFDDCVYYTPAFSDEYIGDLQLRNPINILDKCVKSSTYLGFELNSKLSVAKKKSLIGDIMKNIFSNII